MKSTLVALLFSGFVTSSLASTLDNELKNNAKVVLGHTVGADIFAKSVQMNQTGFPWFAESYKNSMMAGLTEYNKEESNNVIFIGLDRYQFNLTSTNFKWKIDVKIKVNEKNYETTCNIDMDVGFGDSFTSWGRAEFAQRKAGEICSKEIVKFIANQ